ncbi:glutathione S-transferase omega-1-like [Pholidichthys leucotaenia]
MATEKCFAKGSAAPGPVSKGNIRLYSMRFCPYAERTILVLKAKGIKYETINIHLREKPDWFFQMNPLGLVPTLETSDGEVIYESPITCEYLDDMYPDNKLLPSSPFGRAQQKMMLERFSKVAPLFYKITFARRNGEDISELETELKEKLDKLNKELNIKKTKFFGGDSITMIDYMMWPWFERMEVFELQHCLENTPELKKWMECMLEDPAVKATMISKDFQKAFHLSYLDGKPDYDYGL